MQNQTGGFSRPYIKVSIIAYFERQRPNCSLAYASLASVSTSSIQLQADFSCECKLFRFDEVCAYSSGSGRYKDPSATDKPNSRFDPDTAQGKNYRARYWDPTTFKALQIIGEAAEKESLTLGETALRWLSHHSVLDKKYGDAIIVGASSPKHLEENLKDLEKGPLPESVLKALDEAWLVVKSGNLPLKYWH